MEALRQGHELEQEAPISVEAASFSWDPEAATAALMQRDRPFS